MLISFQHPRPFKFRCFQKIKNNFCTYLIKLLLNKLSKIFHIWKLKQSCWCNLTANEIHQQKFFFFYKNSYEVGWVSSNWKNPFQLNFILCSILCAHCSPRLDDIVWWELWLWGFRLSGMWLRRWNERWIPVRSGTYSMAKWRGMSVCIKVLIKSHRLRLLTLSNLMNAGRAGEAWQFTFPPFALPER